ncbi:MAG TPA: dicarboxylate/amino acid:cation symporter, partial [Luteitalea sp.]|nr:dicarboxylate/amino acid:cation symporter [Luteitalea sp.]
HSLYIQVLIGIALGVLVGSVWPEFGASLKPLGDGFIKLVKMLITPIVFTTVVVGIAQMGAMKDVGRVGLRALVYFEVVSTLALVVGLVVVLIVKPGAGMHVSPDSLNAGAVSAYTSGAAHTSATDFLLNIIPDSVVGAFARGDILQVLLFSVLFGLALLHLQPGSAALVSLLEALAQGLFAVVGLVMRLAPIGAFGAMAFTIGTYGVGTLLSLGKLMAAVYITCLLFVLIVLGGIVRLAGFNILKLIRYVREELLIVLGTSSSESALPRVMAKMERLGCSRSVVGLVVPTGYSFNLDGTAIYMTMAAVFVAQATDVQLTLWQTLSMLGLLLVTSKGAAGVTGSGFITLAATLAAVPSIPVAGLTLLLGVDRFMSEARALTNLVGNVVATLVVAKWDGALDVERAHRMLDGDPALAETESGATLAPADVVDTP